MNFFKIVSAIVVALGITEFIKKYVLSFATDLLNRNKEIRKIGTRVQKLIVRLTVDDFNSPIVGSEKDQLYLDVYRMDDDEHKDFTKNILLLINLPAQLRNYNPNENPGVAKTVVEEKQKLYDLTELLNKQCNYYRHYPLVNYNKFTKNLTSCLQSLLHRSVKK